MKHTLLSTIAFFALLSLGFAQSTCVDTLEYPHAKASGYLGSIVNNTSGIPGYAQFYEAPQQISVKGVSLYIGVRSVASVWDTVMCTIYQANPDSTPGAVLATKELVVYNTYPQTGVDTNGSNLDTMMVSVLFDSAISVNSNFLVGVEYNGTLDMGIATNDYSVNDGGMEELAFYKWSTDSLWYKSNDGCIACWDVDYLIMPIVEYTPNYTYSVSSSTCDLTACVNYTESSILSHPMYNEVAFNGNTPSDSTRFSWGDGTSTVYNDTCNTYAMGGNYQIVVSEQIGWGIPAISTDTSSILISGTQGTVLVSHVSCNGLSDGSASVTAAAGFAPYTYLWDDLGAQTNASATGLSPGTYSVVVTDSLGCSDSVYTTVSEPAALTATTSASLSVICNTNSAGIATVSVTGGTLPYSYLWDDPSAQTDSAATGLSSGTYSVVVTDANGCTVNPSITEVGFSIAITSSNSPVCGGVCDGSITVTAYGGSSPLTYSWNDPTNQNTATAGNLCGDDTYVVVVTDADGCTASDSLLLSAPSQLNINVTSDELDCYGDANGTVSVSVSGGAGPYNYLWPSIGGNSGTQNNLSAGTYSVIITDNNGCSVIESASVTQPAAPLSANINSTSVKCYGGGDGSASATGTGGTAPYAYSWNGATAATTASHTLLTAGMYTVTVTDDNSCTYVDTAVVTQPTQIILSGSSSPDLTGNSGSAWVSASGGTPGFSYAWNDDSLQTDSIATGLTMGTYAVTITDDNDCKAILSLSVGDKETPAFQTTFQGANDDFARSIDHTATGGYIIAGYTESFGAGSSDMHVVVTDANGNFAWAKSYGGAEDDVANCVIQTTDGGYAICGYTESFGAGGYDVYLVKTDANGDVTWSETYGDTGDDRGYAVIETSSGYVIAGGTNSFGAGATDAYLIETDANGALQWAKTYGGSGNDYAYSLSAATGGYLIAGNTYSYGSGSADAYAIKTSTSGTITWSAVLGGAGDDEAWSIKEANDGGAIIAGLSNSYGNGENDVFVVKTDGNGATSWTKLYGGDGNDVGYDVEVTSGGYTVAGYSNSFGTGSDNVLLMGIDEAGVEQWSKIYGNSYHDRGWDMVHNTDNSYAVTGNTKSFGDDITAGYWENYLIKTDGDAGSQCNESNANPTETDTTVSASNGGTENSGGTANGATTVSSIISMAGDTVCYTTVGVQKYSIKEMGSIAVYPNPNNGNFSIDISLLQSAGSITLRVLDIQGKLVHQNAFAGNAYSKVIGLSNIGIGMYFVQVVTERGTLSKKIICQ